MATSASKCLYLLNVIKYKLNQITHEHLYVAFVRSKLEYTAIVWDNCTRKTSDLIENVQYRAVKIISEIIHRTSQDLIYKQAIINANSSLEFVEISKKATENNLHS